MIENTHTAEDKELRIDTEAGLQDFLQHTKELYEALIEAAESRGNIDESVALQLQQAEVAFHHACDVAQMSLHSLALGIPINDLLVSEIQDRYNDIATIYDLFTIEVTNDVIIKESDDTYVVLENGDNFVKAARTLTEKAKVLLERYEDITAVKTVKDELNIGEFYYLQLAELAKEVGTTAEVIGQQKDAIETSLPLQSHMTKILQTLDTKLDSLDKELDRFFEPEEISPVSIPEPKQKSNHERTHATRTEHKSEFSTILDRVLLDHRYAKFISERFHSRAQFEAQLRREVERIEAPSKFDILLGVRHPSTFSFLVDRTIEEIVAFDHAPRVVIRGELAAKDIPYEIYVEWMYILGDIQSVLQAPAHITFGELFVRAELEVMLIEQIDTDA